MASHAQTPETPDIAVAAQPQETESERILKLYNEAHYAEAARLGGARVAVEPDNHALRFAVANSYAWTGKLNEAALHYKALQGTSYEDRAALGLANVYRWDGLHGLALPLYQKVLTAQPGDKDAVEGLSYSMRELRPRTQVGVVWATDSTDTLRHGVTLSQRWTDPSSQHRMEIEAGALQDKRNDLKVHQRDLTFRYVGMANPLKPRFEVSGQESPHSALFAAGEIQLPNMPVVLSAGHVNWGKVAFDPNALKANLWANRIGIQARAPSDIGLFSFQYFASRVSDDNLIQDLNFKFVPAWQPVKIQEVKFFVGAEGRKARFNSPAYWSPVDGSYLATIGINAEWQDLVWEKSVLLQYGAPLGGEAESSYAIYARLKRWITNDWAVLLTVASQKNQRSGSYRATSALLSIERLW